MANLETIEEKLDRLLAMEDIIMRLAHKFGVDEISPGDVIDITRMAKKKADKIKGKLHGDQTTT